MTKKKVYSITTRRTLDNEWQLCLQIDHQTIHLSPRETREENKWYKEQVIIAIDRLIEKAKTQ